jgi:hypothetical protein
MAHFTREPNEGPDDFLDRMAKNLPIGAVEQSMRQALRFLWISLPRDQRNPDGLQAAGHQVVDRCIAGFRDRGGPLGPLGEL